MTFLPYSMVSYMLGLTSVSLKKFFVGSLSATIHIVIWLYMGSTLKHFEKYGGIP